MAHVKQTAGVTILAFLTPLLTVQAAADTATQTVEFTEREEAFGNPLKGWVIYGGDYQTPPQPTTLFFSLRSWAELEPNEGQFAFSTWESEVWTPWAEQGMKVIFRVYVDYPGREIGIPQWLIDKGVTLTRYETYGGGWSPDYNHPAFLEGVSKLIQSMGARYDNDPRVACLDVGILGHWGEWHTYPNDRLFASTAVQRGVMQSFLDGFQHKKMMLRVPNSWSASHPFGYRDDCFLTDTDGPEDWKFFNRLRLMGVDTVWQTQPIGGEYCGGGSGALTGTLEVPEESLRLVREGHFSHLGPAGGSIQTQNDEHQRNLDSMLRSMGYRFVVHEAMLPAELESDATGTVSVRIENVGSAPFYYRWPVEIVWMEEAGERIAAEETPVDIRTWLPGSHDAEVTITAPPVSDETRLLLGLRIPDPDGAGPPVRFASQGTEYDGTFVLGSVLIKPGGATVRRWSDH